LIGKCNSHILGVYLGLYKGRLSYRRSLQPQKRTSSTSKLEISYSFSTFDGHFCPPGSGSMWIRIRNTAIIIYTDFQKTTIYCRFSTIAKTSESKFIGYRIVGISPGQVSDKSSPWQESNNLQQCGIRIINIKFNCYLFVTSFFSFCKASPEFDSRLILDLSSYRNELESYQVRRRFKIKHCRDPQMTCIYASWNTNDIFD
jgi:hypothetical protein